MTSEILSFAPALLIHFPSLFRFRDLNILLTHSHALLLSPAIADKTVTIIEPCPTKTSVFALAVTCALLILIYLSTILCYFMKKWMQPHKIMA